MELDHLVVSAERLEDGVAFVEDLCGVTMAPGGQHAVMGTHNRLLSLGPSVYLEVIAIDPGGRDPGRPRWYDLDRFAGPPRLTHWVLRCADLEAGMGDVLPGTGVAMDVSRGDLHWRMAVPDDGRLPLDGCAPALICWGETAHPATRLPDAGCRLTRLEVCHPDIARLPMACRGVAPVLCIEGKAGLCAQIETPKGRVSLQ